MAIKLKTSLELSLSVNVSRRQVVVFFFFFLQFCAQPNGILTCNILVHKLKDMVGMCLSGSLKEKKYRNVVNWVLDYTFLIYEYFINTTTTKIQK